MAISTDDLKEQAVLAAFADREKHISRLQQMGKTSVAVWIVMVLAWSGIIILFFAGQLRFPEFAALVLISLIVSACFGDYHTRFKILSELLLKEAQSKPVVSLGSDKSL